MQSLDFLESLESLDLLESPESLDLLESLESLDLLEYLKNGKLLTDSVTDNLKSRDASASKKMQAMTRTLILTRV